MRPWLTHSVFGDLETAGFALLADAALQATCGLLLAGAAAYALRRRRAAVRHLVWVTACGLLVLFPLFSSVLPGWAVVPDWLAPGAEESAANPLVIRTSPPRSAIRAASDGPQVRSEIHEPVETPSSAPAKTAPTAVPVDAVLPRDVSRTAFETEPPGPPMQSSEPQRWLVTIWLLGMLLGIGRLAVGAACLLRCRQCAAHVTAGPLFEEFERLCRELRLKRRVQLVMGDKTVMPMAWGIGRPKILVPQNVSDWPASQRRAVLLHELGHIVRWDPLWQLIVELARAVYWFHPLMWLAIGRVHLEREQACDDLVLNRGIAAQDYARHLLDVVSGGRLRHFGPAVGVAMASTKRIEGRMRSILDDTRDRRPLTRRMAWSSFAICLIAGMPLAMIRAVPAADSPADSAAQVNAVSPGEPKTAEKPSAAPREEGSPATDPQQTDEKPVIPLATPSTAAKQVTGRVLDADDQPVSGAKVGLRTWPFSQGNEEHRRSGPFLATTVTDGLGRFRLAVPQKVDPDMVLATIWVLARECTPARPRGITTLKAYIHRRELTIHVQKTGGTEVRVRDVTGRPAAGVRVEAVRHRMPESIGFRVPPDWSEFFSAVTDADGVARLPHVEPGALDHLVLSRKGRTARLELGPNFFLNVRPVADGPHFTIQEPETANLVLRLVPRDVELPQNLTVDVSTESRLPNGPRVGVHGTATVAVDGEGKASVEGLAVGPLSILPSLPEDQPLRAEIPDRVVLSPGGTTTLVVGIPVVRGVRVQGLIRKQDTKEPYPNFSLSVIYGQSARDHRDMQQKFKLKTDEAGRFEAVVPPGPIEVRLHSAPRDYRDVEWWGSQIGVWGTRYEIPSGVESFELEPIELVRTEVVAGKLVDADGRPLSGWSIYGYPDIPGLGTPREDFRMNCVSADTNRDGEFDDRYPHTFPPKFWAASHRDWPNPYEFNDKKWDAKVISENPLVLQIAVSSKRDRKPAKNGTEEN